MRRAPLPKWLIDTEHEHCARALIKDKPVNSIQPAATQHLPSPDLLLEFDQTRNAVHVHLQAASSTSASSPSVHASDSSLHMSLPAFANDNTSSRAPLELLQFARYARASSGASEYHILHTSPSPGLDEAVCTSPKSVHDLFGSTVSTSNNFSNDCDNSTTIGNGCGYSTGNDNGWPIGSNCNCNSSSDPEGGNGCRDADGDDGDGDVVKEDGDEDEEDGDKVGKDVNEEKEDGDEDEEDGDKDEKAGDEEKEDDEDRKDDGAGAVDGDGLVPEPESEVTESSSVCRGEPAPLISTSRVVGRQVLGLDTAGSPTRKAVTMYSSNSYSFLFLANGN